MNYETPETNKASLGQKSIENTTEVVSAYFARGLETQVNKLQEDLKSIDELYILGLSESRRIFSPSDETQP